jgi:dephospho-CoA kinase
VLRVGLTGGIACGKSRVRRRLAAAGLGTLDLDAVAHEMIAPGGPAYDDVVTTFGRGILAADGTVDRKVLGARVFADAAARAELNALVHPRVRDEEARRAAAHAAAGGRVFVTDAALLVEAGLHLRFDRLVVVDCEGGEQLRRLVARDAIEEAAARARIAAQMPAGEKRRFAHIVLDASGSLEATDALAVRLAAELAALAEHAPARPPVREASLLGALRAGPAHGPHGLDPARWLVGVARAVGVELEDLKRLLDPPFAGPWYAAPAALGDTTPGAEALALVVGLWSLGRRGLDSAFTAAAMFSMARLTDGNAERTAGACFVALAAAQAGSGIAPDEPERRAWTATAEKWASAAVPPWAQAIIDAARRHPGDERGAAEASRDAGGDPQLAAGLVAAAGAPPETGAPPEWVEAARLLARGNAGS